MRGFLLLSIERLEHPNTEMHIFKGAIVYTTLHIGNQQSDLVLADGSRRAIAIGTDTLLRRNPPSEYEWENAIMTVEDAIAPLQKLIDTSSTFRIAAAEAGLPADSAGVLHRETAEQIFQHISRYPTPEHLPDTAEFKALLLIVRECLHHFDFPRAILIQAP
ncbi:hypothetical protein LVJ83_02970 [Uruburuella testudinis]|uniref:Uncharacterized protein n=1 Tax=Uruburuella testudinis TaxID=1282863 RepID=A0ABY4DVG2_9NEIS|nr:hypothetical protein [Uruburuella testudinis]UOO82453.1 hypothetical protein LVJ83_02970 [Uruburuella testudinis]